MDRPGEPTIREAVPTSGPVGTVVTIYGKNFGTERDSRVVSFNSVPATEAEFQNGQLVPNDGVNRSQLKTAERGAADQKNLQSGQAPKAAVDKSVEHDAAKQAQQSQTQVVEQKPGGQKQAVGASKGPGDVAAQTQGASSVDPLGARGAYSEHGEAEHGVSGAAALATVRYSAEAPNMEEKITVTVPEGATPGDIVVTVAGIASNGSRFTVTAV